MSEGRFKFIIDFKPTTFVDFKTGKHYNCVEVADLVNNLFVENEKLQKQILEYNLILQQHEFAEEEGFKLKQ